MDWLQTLDAGLFRFINLGLSNAVLDGVMSFFSGNVLSFRVAIPAAIMAGLLLIWRGGARGRVFVVMLVLAVGLTDGLVCNTLKHALGRPRPFFVLPEARCLVGKSGSGSMPSSHAANWFAGTMVAYLYYRRSLKFMLPAAAVVSFSRVYNGVHYPSDVMAGAILGAGTAAATVLTLDTVWQWAGRKWCPGWWRRMPSLVEPAVRPALAAAATSLPRLPASASARPDQEKR